MAAPKSKRDILRRSKEREQKMRKFRLGGGFLLVAIIVGSFLGLLNWNFFCFNTVIVAGETNENKEAIQTYVLESIAGRYLGVVPKDSVFFLRKKILAEAVKHHFPRLKDVQVSLPELNTLKISVEDKEAKLVWCDGQDGKKSGHCYYLNEDGEVYSEAPNFSEAVMTEIIAPLPELPIGKIVLASSTVEKIQVLASAGGRLLNGLPGGYAPDLVSWQPLTAGDWAGRVADREGRVWRILFNEKSKTADLVGGLGSILKNETFLTDWSRQKGRLEYIDLRFPQKIFYRFIQ